MGVDPYYSPLELEFLEKLIKQYREEAMKDVEAQRRSTTLCVENDDAEYTVTIRDQAIAHSVSATVRGRDANWQIQALFRSLAKMK